MNLKIKGGYPNMAEEKKQSQTKRKYRGKKERSQKR